MLLSGSLLGYDTVYFYFLRWGSDWSQTQGFGVILVSRSCSGGSCSSVPLPWLEYCTFKCPWAPSRLPAVGWSDQDINLTMSVSQHFTKRSFCIPEKQPKRRQWKWTLPVRLIAECTTGDILVSLQGSPVHVSMCPFTRPYMLWLMLLLLQKKSCKAHRFLIRSWQKMPDFPIIQGLRTEPKPGDKRMVLRILEKEYQNPLMGIRTPRGVLSEENV